MLRIFVKDARLAGVIEVVVAEVGTDHEPKSEADREVGVSGFNLFVEEI